MEGMFTKEMMPIQADYVKLGKCTLTLDKWAQELVVKLLEVTHRQWLYRNIHVYDARQGWRQRQGKRRYSNSLRIRLS